MMKLVNHCFSACFCQLKLFLDTLRHAQMTTPGISFQFSLSLSLALSLSPLVLLLYMRNACARPRINRQRVTTLQGVNSPALHLQQVARQNISKPLLLLHFSRFHGSRRGREGKGKKKYLLHVFLHAFGSAICT